MKVITPFVLPVKPLMLVIFVITDMSVAFVMPMNILFETHLKQWWLRTQKPVT